MKLPFFSFIERIGFFIICCLLSLKGFCSEAPATTEVEHIDFFRYVTYDTKARLWRPTNLGSLQSKRIGYDIEARQLSGHRLAKIYWEITLNPGDKFTFEMRGGHSVEWTRVDGPDQNLHVIHQDTGSFSSYEILRTQNGYTFSVNGQPMNPKNLGLPSSLPPGHELETKMFPATSAVIGRTFECRNARVIRSGKRSSP